MTIFKLQRPLATDDPVAPWLPYSQDHAAAGTEHIGSPALDLRFPRRDLIGRCRTICAGNRRR